jgi:hypothetical protein
MTLAESKWAQFWAAADSGEAQFDREGADADGGEQADTGSHLAGLMLERFDDDECWRKLARTGRSL